MSNKKSIYKGALYFFDVANIQLWYSSYTFSVLYFVTILQDFNIFPGQKYLKMAVKLPPSPI